MNRVVYVALLGLILIALASCGDGGEDTTPTFSLSGSDVTVTQGGQNKAAIALAFNAGAKDVVTLSLEAPEGITGTFEPATVSITSPKSLLSVSVAASVVPDKYELIVKGSSGARVNTAKIQLTVEAVPVDNTPTFNLSGTPVTITQGSSGTSTITATFDAGATDIVTLGLESPDAGITGTFEPKTFSASSLNSVLSLDVATTVAPGSYELTVEGSSGAKINSTKIQLIVEELEETTEIITLSSSTDFSISLRINGTLSTSQRKAFVDAAQRWSSIITASTGIEEDITIPADTCDAGFPEFSGTITNVLIDLRITEIDGPDNILGQAGWCQIHSASKLTAYGIMEFDVADVATLETDKQFDLVILHEMGHVLGYGTLWTTGRNLAQGLGTDRCGDNPIFVGANAVREWQALGRTGERVPLENQGGQGTCESHWREALFGNELMTGFLNQGVTNPLSKLTIASMEDLGYEVDYTKADAYSITQKLQARRSEPSLELRMLRIEPEGVISQ